MNIVVVIKATFDTEETIVIENGQIIDDGIELILNPYDEYAVEEALRIKESQGGEVTAITVGSDQAESILRTVLAMGVDKAIFIEGNSLSTDEYTISKILAAAIRQQPFDLVLAGNMSIDRASSQIGPRLAEELGIAHVSAITEIMIDGSKATVVRDVEGNSELIDCEIPLLVTAQQGLNEPRYPSLSGIMKAKKKKIDHLEVDDLDLDDDSLQEKTVIVDHYLPKKKESGRIIYGELDSQVKELISILGSERKVI